MIDELPMSFGALLRGCRGEANLTQEELAEQAGISWRTISDLERGLKLPRRDTLAMLAAALPLSDEQRAAFLILGRRPSAGLVRGSDAPEPPAVGAAREQSWVYVVHAQGDDAVVGRLYNDLQQREIAVWTDERDLLPGTPNWEHALRGAIRASIAVLLIASPRTRSSRYVADELRVAELYGRRVYPLWIGGEQWIECVPLGWGGLQYLDARGEQQYDEALAALVAALRQQEEKQARSSRAARMQPIPETEPRNPYKGLRTFTGDDTGDFFGRDDLIDVLLAALPPDVEATPRFLALTGASGSGKSSVVLAGLLPRLQAGALPGSEQWIYVPAMTPGTRPLDMLAHILAGMLPAYQEPAIREELTSSIDALHTYAGYLVNRVGQRVVIVLDQFEELFSPAVDEQERRCVIDLLTAAVSVPSGSALILLTMRADFYDRPLRYPALGALIDRHGVAVLPPSMTDLRRAIEAPAALPDVGITFEDDLVGDLLFDLRGQAGVLPLLQFTLDQLFSQREGRRLTRAAYLGLGGVRGALALHAEGVYGTLADDDQRTLARSLFLRLIDPGATEQDTTRRRLAMVELELPDQVLTTHMRVVVEAFVTARLLVVAHAPAVKADGASVTVEVSHEALIREWGRLGEWLHEAREDIRRQHSISADAWDWERQERPMDRVYRGSLLLEAESWSTRNMPSAREITFIQAGRTETDRQQTQEHARQARQIELAQHASTADRLAARRLRLLVGILALFLLVAAVLSAVAINNTVQARQAETRALHDQKAAAANAKAANRALHSLNIQQRDNSSTSLATQATAHARDAHDLGLLLAVEAERSADTPEARGALLDLLRRAPSHLIARLNSPTSNIHALAFSPDRRILAVGGDDDTIRLLKIADGSAIGSPLTGPTGTVTSIAFSPDATLLAAGSTDHKVRLWRKTSADGPWRPYGEPLTGPGDVVRVVAFSPYGTLLAASSWDHSVWLWQVTGPNPPGTRLTDEAGDVGTMAFSPDGSLIASASLDDSSIQLWDVARRVPVGSAFAGQADTIAQLAFSPTGTTLASTDDDGALRFWDVRRRRLLGSPLAEHVPFSDDLSNNLAFSPDGTILAVADGDQTMLWSVARRLLVGAPLSDGAGAGLSLAFSADGSLLATGGTDHTVRLWDVSDDASNPNPIAFPLRSPDPLNSVAFSPDGKTLATGDLTGHIRLWEVAGHHKIGAFATKNAVGVDQVVFSKVGHVLASLNNDGTVTLWDLTRRTGNGISLTTSDAYIIDIAFSPDGGTLATENLTGAISLWSVADRRMLGSPLPAKKDADSTASALAFSPNGNILASSGNDGMIQLWDLKTRQASDITLPSNSGIITALAFSPDSSFLASGDVNGAILLWNLALEPRQGTPLATGSLAVQDLAFSPDGTMLTSGGFDGAIRIWSIATRTLIGPTLSADGPVTSVAYNPDGTILASGDYNGKALLWDMNMASLARRACRLTDRSLTLLEWHEYLGNAPYQQSCPATG